MLGVLASALRTQDLHGLITLLVERLSHCLIHNYFRILEQNFPNARLLWFSYFIRCAIDRAKLLTAYHGENRAEALTAHAHDAKL